jgi:Rod binding domain-containing protein
MDALGRIGAEVGAVAGTRQLAQASGARERAAAGRVEEAAQMFEALLATVLVKQLRAGLSEGFFGSGPGSDVFEGWLDEHLGQTLAERGALDVAGFIRVNLTQKQALGAESGAAAGRP